VLEQSASENTSLIRDNRLATVKQEIKSFNSRFEVKEIDNPKTWRLLMLSTAEKDEEEAVFTVQGIIVSKELPPKAKTKDNCKPIQISPTRCYTNRARITNIPERVDGSE